MWAALFWVATAGLSPGLKIESGSPDALCPELGSTRAAVEARLGVVAVKGQGGWTARYTMWHAPDQDSDFIRLEVIDPSGRARLVRDLPLSGASCSTMASIIALVLDRYFRDLQGPRDFAPAPSSSPERQGTHVVLDLAAGAILVPARFGLLGTIAVESRQARLAIQTGWSPSLPTEQIGNLGVARMTTSVPIRLTFAWQAYFRHLQIQAGPELFSAYERARADIASGWENSRLAVGAGIQGGVAVGLGRGVRLTADLAVDRVLGGGRFIVDTMEILRVPWRAVAAIGIAYVIGNEGP